MKANKKTREQVLQIAKPILFNTEMVRAIQNNTKTATRRVIKGVPETAHMFLGINTETQKAEFLCGEIRNGIYTDFGVEITLPYKVGDILYVRETWSVDNHNWLYRADFSDKDLEKLKNIMRWGPSIHMPKKIARLFLRVTDVTAERLQDIDDDGVVAEGLEIGDPFDELWNSTIKKSEREKYGWDANPWVWVIEFERVEVTE